MKQWRLLMWSRRLKSLYVLSPHIYNEPRETIMKQICATMPSFLKYTASSNYDVRSSWQSGCAADTTRITDPR